jgi:glycine cleavage system H protein
MKSEIPENLKYAETHEWVRFETDGTVTIGISDHAQQSLGDLVFIELPEKGQQFKVADQIGVVESVKAASDIFTPIAGEVIEVNDSLADAPELVNNSPYQDGWLLKLKPAENSNFVDLLTAEQYAEIIADED